MSKGLSSVVGVVASQIVPSREHERKYSADPEKAAYEVAGDVATLRMFMESAGGGGYGDVEVDVRPMLIIEAGDRLRELEYYFTEAFRDCSDYEITYWSMARLPMKEEVSDFGERKWTQYTLEEVCSYSREMRQYRNVRRIAKWVYGLDNLLWDVLDRNGEVAHE